ncbi:MAG: YdaS family helix-turn-helix protein [Syntrophotalea acetylenica]|nr:YdaS family helix-turn-helix protein [Syntrophotalea acetylenica]
MFDSQARFLDALNQLLQADGDEGNLKSGHISYWTKTRVPARHALLIEKATAGRIPRHRLRPDIYPPEEYALVVNGPQIRAFVASLTGGSDLLQASIDGPKN